MLLPSDINAFFWQPTVADWRIGCKFLLWFLWIIGSYTIIDNSLADSPIDKWLQDVKQIQILLHNDIPRGYEEAKNLLNGLPVDAPPAHRIMALNLLARAEGHMALVDLGDEHARQALRLAIQQQDLVGQVEAWLNLSLSSVNQADSELLSEAPMQALTLLQDVENRPDLLGEAMLRVAMMYLRFNKLEESVTISVELMETARQESDPFMLTYAYQALAIAYELTHRYQDSLVYYEGMLKHAKEIPSKVLQGDALKGIALVKSYLGETTAAEPIFHQALALYREAGGPLYLSTGLFGLAENLRAQGRYEESLRLFTESLAIQEKYNNRIGMWWVLVARSSNYQELGKLDESMGDAQRADGIATQIGMSLYRSRSKQRMAEVAHAQGDYRQAFEFTTLSSTIADDANTEHTSQRMLEMVQRYRQESKQRRLEELERKNALQSSELRQREIRQRWMVVVLIIIIAALLATAYLLHRLRQSHRLLKNTNKHLANSRNELREKSGILQSVLDSMGDGVAVADEKGGYMLLNPIAKGIIGDARMLNDKSERSDTYGYFLPDKITHYPLGELPLSKAIAGVPCDNVEMFVRNAAVSDGRWLSVTARPLIDRSGMAKGGVAVFSDITIQKNARRQMELSARVIEQSAEGIIIFDADKNILTVNRAFCEMLGYESEDLVGGNLDSLQYDNHDQEYVSHIRQQIWHHVDQDGFWQGEIRERHKSGVAIPVFLSISVVLDEQERIINYIGINRDISQHKEAEAHIHQLAYYDALTALPNRFLFNDRIEQAISHARREGHPIALMFLDLDRFKNINDSLGHRIGDSVLIETARRLKKIKRGEDTVSRLGGDEFTLLLPGTDSDGAAHVAKNIIRTISEPYHISQHELLITPSIGICIYPNDGDSAEILIQNADSAMYRAKKDGRSVFRFFTQEMYQRANLVLKLENALHNALQRREFFLHYQPQIDMLTGNIVGCEALLRWKHAEYGMVPPADFIPIAEDTGQILSIGGWVLQTAIRQVKMWQRSGLPLLPVSVNLSAVQFRQANLIERISQMLQVNELPPEFLELELTESITMENPAIAINIMNQLNRCGIRLSIDDFGTGYSSLSYLKRLNIHRLKIDQSFIRDITVDTEDEEIVRTIITLAKSLKLQTVAEGVETNEQMDLLKAEGCNVVQGYYFSKPLPPDEFAELLYAEQSMDRSRFKEIVL
jgi:diguanylate cyclase (GGDEF)-like protein/PAS domain S-box-containing protein